LHEVIHEFRRSGKHGVIFKIDFEKAYNKVKWEFLQEVMERKGYPPNWIKRAMCTIQGGEYASMLMEKGPLTSKHTRVLGRGILFRLYCSIL
jgi:hypothetical protein